MSLIRDFQRHDSNPFVQRSPFWQKRKSRGLTKIEYVVVAVIVGIGICLLLPWILRQRSNARQNMCQAKQFCVARAVLLLAEDKGFLSGYRNPLDPANPSLVQSASQNPREHQLGPVEPALLYLFALNPKTDVSQPELGLEQMFRRLEKGQLPEGKYFQEAHSTNDAFIPRIPELNCPDQGAIDYLKHPDASTTIFNCGMRDFFAPESLESENNPDPQPQDFRANGPFLDLTNKVAQSSRVSLEYIKTHDGLSTTLLLTENLDAGGYLSTNEFDVGFVWRDEPSGSPGDQLLGINQLGRQRPSDADKDLAYQFARPSSFHVDGVQYNVGGVNVVYCDGSTQFLPEDIDYVLFALLMSCDDHDVKTPGSSEPVSALYRREPPEVVDETEAHVHDNPHTHDKPHSH